MKDAEIRKILTDTSVFVADWMARDPRVNGVIEKALNILSVQSAALTEIARGAFSDLDFEYVVAGLAEQSQLVGMGLKTEPPAADAGRGG